MKKDAWKTKSNRVTSTCNTRLPSNASISPKMLEEGLRYCSYRIFGEIPAAHTVQPPVHSKALT